MRIKVIKTFRKDQKEEMLNYKKFFTKTVGFSPKAMYGKDPEGLYPEEVYTVYVSTDKEYNMYQEAHKAGKV